jgi:endonuclease/exonuclease/phosphatase family metal-dependent hydrolase
MINISRLNLSSMIALTVMIFILILLIFLIWASQTNLSAGINKKAFHTDKSKSHEKKNDGTVKNNKNLKVMTFNLSFAYGVGNEGLKRSDWTKDIMGKQLDQLVNLINEDEIDLVLLQEIDFDSQRSFHIDQLNYLVKKTQLKFSSKAVSWKQNFIPYPYWPLLKKFGQINSGGAILSRYPILDEEIHLLEKPKSNPWWYNIFYLYRYFQICTINLQGEKIDVINLHLEAYDGENRREQIELLLNQITSKRRDQNEQVQTVLIGGDFNLLPPNTKQKSAFSDGDDYYENDLSGKILFDKMPLREIVELDEYQKNESSYWTFPSNLPNRRLDYLFYHPSFLELKNIKFMKKFDVSDHLPVIAEFGLILDD